MATRNNTWIGLKKSTKRKSKNNQPEYELQKAVCKYLDLKYKPVFYNGSAGGMRTYLSVAKRMKATGYKSGFPDIFLYEPKGEYSGLAIELKVKGNYASENQKKVLLILNQKGYQTAVCTGLDDAIKTIDEYLAP